MKRAAATLLILLGGCEAQPQSNVAATAVEDPMMSNLDATALNDLDASIDNLLAEAPPEAPQTGWSYSEKKDEMRGNTARFARLSARDQIHLDFPYGASTPELALRQDPKYGFDIYLSANGQFLCRSWDDDTISVKFDDGPIESWACADAESGSSDIIFITAAERFLAKLRKAKRVVIEADMYQAGRQQMSFDVAGLEWGTGKKKG